MMPKCSKRPMRRNPVQKRRSQVGRPEGGEGLERRTSRPSSSPPIRIVLNGKLSVIVCRPMNRTSIRPAAVGTMHPSI